MDFILVNPQIHSTFGSLGYIEGDTYHINDDCLTSLQEILTKLTAEDRTLRTFRRAVGFGQNVKKDLVPILIHVKDNPKIIEITIKILVNLTIPVECLLSIDDLSRNNVGRHTIHELNNLLLSSKAAFTDSRATKAVIKYIQHICEMENKMPPAQVENVNNSLLLLRNILHVPMYQNGISNPTTHGSSQNQILWNLFTQSIDKILLFLITSAHGSKWSVTMVQLIALIYKDQHVGTLQKLLNIWFESSLSESSDDNESNTSPPEQGSDDSSPMVTSEPTSDSSDTGGGRKCNTPENRVANAIKDNKYHQIAELQKSHTSKHASSANGPKHTPAYQTQKNNAQFSKTTEDETMVKSLESKMLVKRESISTNSEFSDCGYVTQLETQESISTSSNEDDAPQQKPVHLKPHGTKQRHGGKARAPVTVQEKKDKRRKKLVKRSKTNIINMKGLALHAATDEDITNVLKEFTVDFLLKGYGSLVHSLYTQLLFDLHLQIDTSHFFWLVTYFLKFAAQLELDMEHVYKILSFEIISYLTYEGVHLCEQIQLLSKTQSGELKPSLRRMHLVVTAIREFIQTVDTYGKINHLSEDDKAHLKKLQAKICSTDELRCLLVLLIRHFQPDVHSKQYLQDLIVTNHILLLFLDNGMKQPDIPPTNMVEHIKQFATVEVMHQYGLLLEDFRSNGEFVNDCIFTMMHHIGGDLNSITTLFQPNILKIFSLIWETDFEICDDWSDLVDYVINQFIKTPRPRVPSPIYETGDMCHPKSNLDIVMQEAGWTKEEKDKLHWFYMQSNKDSNIIKSVSDLFRETGVEKSDLSIIEQLYEQQVISREEYLKLQGITENTDEEDIKMESCSIKSIVRKDDIELLKEDLVKQNMEKALIWLQKELLEVCYAKICFADKTNEENINIQDQLKHVIEPIAFHNILVNQSIPIVPWSNEQSTAIHNQTFLHLLHRLGFHLPVDSGKLFVRIPNFWTTDVLLHIATRLGPIDPASIKFSLSDVYGGISDNKESESMEYLVKNEEDIKSTKIDSVSVSNSLFRIHRNKQIHSLVQFTPLPSSSLPMDGFKSTEEPLNWLNLIMKTKPTCCEQEKIPRPKSSRRNLPSNRMRNCFKMEVSAKRKRV